MKKLLLFASVFTLLFTSCSKDEEEELLTLPTGILLTKVIDTYSDGTTDILNITYNGNKIVTLAYEGGENYVYTYTGDLITKEDLTYYNGAELNGHQVLYEYDTNSRLIRSKRTLMNSSTTEIDNFTYNTDNTVSFVTTVSGETQATGTIYFNGNQPFKKVITNYVGTPIESTSTQETFYDNNISPFASIIGWSKIDIALPRNSIGFYGSFNNVIKVVTDGVSEFEATYTYNANNMPLTEMYSGYGGDYNSQYFYN